MARKLPKADEERQKEEYLALLVVFKRLLERISEDMYPWDVLEELMALRAEFAIQHAIKGFGMDYDRALELVRKFDGELSDEEKEQRIILVAAIDNLIDFAVAEEYQMAAELPEPDEEPDEDSDDEETAEEDRDEYDAIFFRYNYRYANVENLDIEYAMIVAAGLVSASPRTILTYMTQGDERVRPWHLQYEGFSAPKSDFPAWLIPPIEHQCRCYLLTDEVTAKLPDVSGRKIPEMPEWFNPVFRESVALGGRIFSDAHHYFEVKKEHRERLRSISSRIKIKYLTNADS